MCRRPASSTSCCATSSKAKYATAEHGNHRDDLTGFGRLIAPVLDFAPRFAVSDDVPAAHDRSPSVDRRAALISVRLRPASGHGSKPPEITLGAITRFLSPTISCRDDTHMPVSYVLHVTNSHFDRPINIFVGHDETLSETPHSSGALFLAETASYWQCLLIRILTSLRLAGRRYRAAITLKLCSFDDTGAIVAALTTSIPEAAGSSRNWDYRFCWLRDAFFTVTALNRVSATRTMESFVRFVLDLLQRADDQPSGRFSRWHPAWIRANVLPSCLRATGHRTRAHRQCRSAATSKRRVRIDRAYGGSDVLGSAAAAARRPQSLSPALPSRPRRCRSRARARCRPLGYRNRSRVHTFSAAMCWAALHRLGHIARHLGIEQEAESWLDQAAKLRRRSSNAQPLQTRAGFRALWTVPSPMHRHSSFRRSGSSRPTTSALSAHSKSSRSASSVTAS